VAQRVHAFQIKNLFQVINLGHANVRSACRSNAAYRQATEEALPPPANISKPSKSGIWTSTFLQQWLLSLSILETVARAQDYLPASTSLSPLAG
jgi:hypothetical protein